MVYHDPVVVVQSLCNLSGVQHEVSLLSLSVAGFVLNCDDVLQCAVIAVCLLKQHGLNGKHEAHVIPDSAINGFMSKQLVEAKEGPSWAIHWHAESFLTTCSANPLSRLVGCVQNNIV